MNMHTMLDTSAQVLKYKLEQLQGLPEYELRAQVRLLAKGYRNCSICGPVFIGDDETGEFQVEIDDGTEKVISHHRPPAGYNSDW